MVGKYLRYLWLVGCKITWLENTYDAWDWLAVKSIGWKILMIFVIGMLLKWQGVSVLVPLRCWT